jgi:type II secretory pathway pseudopilin PulG
MINLIPVDYRRDISYARKNAGLVQWLTGSIFGLIGLIIVIVAGMIFLQGSVNTYSKQRQDTENNLKAQNIEETQKQVAELSNDLKLVVDVLSKEILFSKLVPLIGSAIPRGAVLTDLGIADVKGGLILTAIATDYNTATQVQINLQDPANKIFAKADIEDIKCSSGTTNTSQSALQKRYPCEVRLKTLFAKNNSYFFLDDTKTKNKDTQ